MWRPSVALESITRNSNAVCFKYAKGWRHMNSDSALIIGIDIRDFSGIIFVFFHRTYLQNCPPEVSYIKQTLHV